MYIKSQYRNRPFSWLNFQVFEINGVYCISRLFHADSTTKFYICKPRLKILPHARDTSWLTGLLAIPPLVGLAKTDLKNEFSENLQYFCLKFGRFQCRDGEIVSFLLTIDLRCVNFSIQHEIWLVENIPHRLPMPVLIRVRDRLSNDAETHQYNQQDRADWQHIYNL